MSDKFIHLFLNICTLLDYGGYFYYILFKMEKLLSFHYICIRRKERCVLVLILLTILIINIRRMRK